MKSNPSRALKCLDLTINIINMEEAGAFSIKAKTAMQI